MDSFHTFMDIFQRALQEKNIRDLESILKNSKKYFENIPKSNIELVLDTIFSGKDDLICFIKYEFNREVPQKSSGFDMAVKEGFHFLEFIMEQFSNHFDPYKKNVKSVCEQALTVTCSMYIKQAACTVLKKLIQLYQGSDIDLSETVNSFVKLLREQKMKDIKERSVVLSVLGTISKYNPEIPEIRKNSTLIFRQIRNDFIILNQPGPSSSVIQIQMYLDIFADVLELVPEDFIKEGYRQELYGWIKNLSSPTRDFLIKKVVTKSAINLLCRHIQQFNVFVHRDYEFWYNVIKNVNLERLEGTSKYGQEALKVFYREIGHTLKHNNSDENRKVFLYFKKVLEEELRRDYSSCSTLLRYTVYGYSQMAAPCKTYLTPSDVKLMFSLIVQRAIPLCSQENLSHEQLKTICDYQEALSVIILYISDLTLDQIYIILKLSNHLVKRFPAVSITGQTLAVSSVQNTIMNIGSINRMFLEEFLYNLMHEGVRWSCSHTLLIDVELQRDSENLESRPISYKNYLPLWSKLLRQERYKKDPQIAQDVVDMMINICIVLISKLNLNIKVREDNVYSDAALSQIAENETDFRIFINIVDLYVDIIKELDASLLKNNLQKFLSKMINLSQKHPTISGFYKLVHVSFKYICSLSLDQVELEILEYLYKYLARILDLIPTFSNELLITCLHLILDTPITYVKNILDGAIPAFKIAFTVGLSDFDLACTALNTLEKWTNHFDSCDTNQLLREIVPFLEPFIQSKESSTELLQDIMKMDKKNVRRVILIDDENTLEKFQTRILLFIASLDTDIVLNFIYKKSMNTGATWNKKNLLEYSLPFSDIQIHIHLDKILPRLIVLAQNSGDKRTKMIACEVLYSVVQFTIGITRHFGSNKDFETVYMLLYPTLLKLSCDSDIEVQQIFKLLMLQLTHWLSSKAMLDSQISENFLEIVFNGLSNDSNALLREFSGICLAEFTKWSIKQSDTEDRTQHNIRTIINKITYFALHPTSCKRIAAAIAFNHLYTILREDNSIVIKYWLQIFYCFVKCLNGCSDPSINIALKHVERVLKEKESILNGKYGRIKPPEFESATLKDAVNWLFIQCGCLDQNCRTKCMELFIRISKYVENCDSAESMVKNYLDSNGIEALNTIILKELNPKIENLSSASSISPLLKSLECYIWLMQNKLVDAETLFGNENSKREVVFDGARNLLHIINNVKMETEEENPLVSLKVSEELQTLQCKIIVSMFNLLDFLFNVNGKFVPEFFLNADLFEIFSKCIMHPQTVGFGAKDLETAEALTSVVERLLRTIQQKSSSLLKNIENHLTKYITKHIDHFLNLDNIIYDVTSNEMKQYIKGLHTLVNCGTLYHRTKIFDDRGYKITRIFEALAEEQRGNYFCANINLSAMDYLQSLMNLLLTYYEPSTTRSLVALIANDTMLRLDFTNVNHGMYFLSKFKDVIFKYMLKDIEATLEILYDSLQTDRFLMLTVIEDLLIFVWRHKKELHPSSEILACTLINKFAMFNRAGNNLENRKQNIINIYGIAVHLRPNVTDISKTCKEFYNWIIEQLTDNSDLEYKNQILQNFLICLTDATSTKPEIIGILRTLKNDVCPSDFTEQNMKALKATNCFQTLSSLLPVTKSTDVFESIIRFAAGSGAQLCNEKTNENLQQYFAHISSESALRSLELAYRLYINLNTSSNERFDVLHKFLLPAFQFCRIAEIQQFFERNIKDIHTIIHQNIVGTSMDIKQLIISKIGCYELIGIMSVKISLEDLEDPGNLITKNAITAPKTGETLLGNLFRRAYEVRKLKVTDPEDKELMRLLQCSAFKCAIAIACLKKHENWYTAIFGEEKEKAILWENIVDCDKRYDIDQTLKENRKHCKQLINIRETINVNRHVSRYSYIHNYNITASTLDEDINAYDFNKMTLLDVPRNGEESMSLIFESDELNNHECMGTICALLKHLITEGIYVPPTEDEFEMPPWFKVFCKSIRTAKSNNVRLFLCQIICNMQTVFQPYAKLFLLPLINTMNLYLMSNKLNYVITDVIVMLIGWGSVALPSTDREKNAAQKFWELLINKVIINPTSEIPKNLHRYNMVLVNTILEAWRACLKLPSNLSQKMETEPSAAVYLTLICFVNGMEKELAQRNDVLQFIEKSLGNWTDKEETIVQSYECAGLLLKFFTKDDQLSQKKVAMIEHIKSIFQVKLDRKANCVIKCIQALCKSYPEAATVYFQFVSSRMSRMNSEDQSKCLEIFLLHMDTLNEPDILTYLTELKFDNYLKNKITFCDRVALKIVDNLVSVLLPANLLPRANLALPYTKHNLSDYREKAYTIYINIYKKYATDESSNEHLLKLVDISKEVLLAGLLDPNEELQEKVLNFWTQEAQLSNNSKERLLNILRTYTPNASDAFLPFILFSMLDLTKKSPAYTETLFPPLHKCEFKELKIAFSWRAKNLNSRTPLFVPSHASQIVNQTFTQNLDTLSSMPQSYSDELMVHATRNLEFVPTPFDDDQSSIAHHLEYDDEFQQPSVPQPIHNKKSKRIIRNSSDVGATIRQQNIIKNIKRDEMIKEEVARQRSTAKLYRKYRQGDFPDIEISHSTIIELLLKLARNDQLFCKDLTVFLICALLDTETSEDFRANIAKTFKYIVENHRGNSFVVAAVLEILAHTRIPENVLEISPEIIAKVSKSNNLNFLGSIVLEETLIYGADDVEPPRKRVHTQSCNKWLQLTSLYESMDDIDVVLSIFQSHIEADDMREAALAQASNDWSKAKSAYEKAYMGELEPIQEHSLRGLLECLNNLRNWKEIDKHVQRRLKGDTNNIWTDQWKDWMFPWLFDIEVNKLLNGKESKQFVTNVESWSHDEKRNDYMRSYFGEELSMFSLPEKLHDARESLMYDLDETREQWIKLHPLSTRLRIRKLEKLRIINDINLFLRTLTTAKTPKDLQSALKFWSRSVPSTQDSILPWDKLISYRIHFASLFEARVNEWIENANDTESISNVDETAIIQELNSVTFELQLKMIEAALNQKNKYMAQYYIKQAAIFAKNPNYPMDQKNKLELFVAKTRYLSGEIVSDAKEKLRYYESSWTIAHSFLRKDLDSTMKVCIRQHISNVASKLVQLSQEDKTFATLLTSSDAILRKIDAENNNYDTVKNTLEAYSSNHLKSCCDRTAMANGKECYFTLAKYCYERLSRDSSDDSLRQEFVNSTLKAMKNGSLEAAHYFPCLLKPEYLEGEEAKKIFVEETEQIQDWLFLSWQAQLFSHVGSSIASLIIPILERIVEKYPYAVIYTFKLLVEANPALLTDTRTYKIRKILTNKPEVEQFLEAMQYVIQPELYLQYYLIQFIRNLSLGTSTAIDILLKKVYSKSIRGNANDPKPGKIYTGIAQYEDEIKALEGEKPEMINQKVEAIRRKLTMTRKGKWKLEHYSPWLADFVGAGDLEIPGQYSGNRKPMPEYHAKIMKIEPRVKVMQSLRAPIRITMVGNDGKEYKFLVKFGEDLRLDQRLQQLFTTMNKTLHGDANCRRRRLSIDTYQVIPLSKTCGLIQWIKDTRSLHDLIHFALSKKQIQSYYSIFNDYKAWVRSAAPLKNVYEQYKKSTVKYNAAAVINKMNQLINKTEWDNLRKTLKLFCPSLESFVILRQNFITTYATMCIAHWILGIGDRHLGNILISIGSGRCLGIDFGLAFDAGIDQRVPELMPFRLTTQICGLLKPFSEKDLLGVIMIYALRALRNEQGPILSCMDVFVHEPLNWTTHINKTLKENEDDVRDVKWLPKKKISVVTKKLNGTKSSFIVLEQLKDQHNDEYFERYRAIVTGDDDIKRSRARMKNEHLTPEEQVECLLDQATDLNILGRSQVGYEPWL